ncbi:MAG: HDIG domain-containing metalloprotein [Oligosphaeraceae bacterium]
MGSTKHTPDTLPPPTPLTQDEQQTQIEHFREGLKASCQESLSRSRQDTSWSLRFFDRDNCLGALLFFLTWLLGSSLRLLITSPLDPREPIAQRLTDRSFLLFLLVQAFSLAFLQATLNTPWRTARPIPKLKEYLLVSLSLMLEFTAVALLIHSSYVPTDRPWNVITVLPLAIFPALLINLLDARAAACTAILQAILLPLQIPTAPTDNTYQLFCFTLIVSVASVLCFRNIRFRLHYLTHGLLQGIVVSAMGLLAFYLGGSQLAPETDILDIILHGLAQGVLTGLACLLFLPLLELLFRIPTPMTLAELTDVNTPLLQRLRAEAPGTYQHSLDVAEMATNAASAIGADAKLVHVMALYHDVGKLFAPQYFAENMTSRNNPLENGLSPEESANLIFEHTTHGVQLAQKYHISPLVIPAIRQHHGNTLLEHFYKKACDQAAAEGAPLPAEERYRYPQKPFTSREVAILSMADSCEAAVRALLSATPDLTKLAREIVEQTRERDQDATAKCLDLLTENLGQKELSHVVRAIDERIAMVFRKRYDDHQLDQVDLTTKELATMARSFRETILFHFHSRPEYRTAGADYRGR